VERKSLLPRLRILRSLRLFKRPSKSSRPVQPSAGRYQIIEELGKGGMGKVYKVFDTDIKEKVALKLLKPEIASDKETIERAREEYQKMISLTTGRLSYGDLFAKSFYGLGKIYQQKKWTAKTIEQYREFLTLWKDSDPGIPELIDAKNRFAELLDK